MSRKLQSKTSVENLGRKLEAKGENLNGKEQWPVLENGGKWASGGLWSSESRCPPGSAICGLQTKIQPFAGKGVTYDDAGLTDLKFICCET